MKCEQQAAGAQTIMSASLAELVYANSIPLYSIRKITDL